MPADDTSINVGAGDEDDDLLAQANALLEDDPISKGRQIKKKITPLISIPIINYFSFLNPNCKSYQ